MTLFRQPVPLAHCALALLLSSACGPGQSEQAGTPDAGPDVPACTGILCKLGEGCPAGAMPDLEAGGCRPVGWTECAAGFEPDPASGSCRERLPSKRCADATREALGSSDCIPLGDCSAPFPPPDATHFVDDSYLAAQLDGTHFRRIIDALAAAPAGAVIAVEQGVYPEALEFPRSVTLAGRCAAKVVLDGRWQGYVGLNAVQPQSEVMVRGLTVYAHGRGAMIFDGARLTLQDVLLRNQTEVGVVVSGKGSRATFERMVIRDTGELKAIGWGAVAEQGGELLLRDVEVAKSVQAGVVVRHPGSKLTLERTVVRGTLAGAQQGGAGVVAQEQGALAIRRSAILQNDSVGISLFDAGTLAAISETVVAETRQPGTDFGRGVQVQDGAELTLTRSALRGNVQSGLNLSNGPGSGAQARAKVEQVTIFGTLPSKAPAPLGDGLNQYGGWGAVVQKGSRLDASELALVRNQEAGLLLSSPSSSARVLRSLVADTQVNPDGDFGRGVVVIGGAALEMDTSVITGNREGGLDVEGPGAESSARLSRCAIVGTLPSRPGPVGAIGAIARNGGLLHLDQTLVGMSPEASGIVFADSRGVLSAVEVVRNRIGVSAQQGCVVSEVSSPAGEPSQREVLVTSDSVFLENDSRLSAAELPLPPSPVLVDR